MTDQSRLPHRIIGATMFSGIGAPETAMPSWDWAWSAEIDKFPAAVLAERHPESTNLGDVTADDFTKRAAIVGAPNVLVFGSPCQDFSVAGRRAGLAGRRGNLSMVALDILGELRPRWFVFENVPGLLSIDEGGGFQWFLSRVDAIGYSLAWAVLDAQFFGLAQRRERVFAVGCLGDWRGPAAVLLEPEGLCGDSPPRRKTGEGVAVSPTLRAGGNSTGGDRPPGTDVDTCDSLIPSHQVAQPLLAKGNSSHRADAESYVAHTLRGEGFDAGEDGTGRGTPLVPHAFDARQSDVIQYGNMAGPLDTDGHSIAVAFSCKDHGADAGEIAPTLRSMGHDRSHANAGGQIAVAFHENQRGELTINETAGSLKVGGGKPGQGYPAVAFQQSQSGMRCGEVHATLDSNNGSRRHNGVAVRSGVRRLTPRECERLQGFPDDYTQITYRKKPAADGPRYKALGNSMPVPVMRWILNRIEIIGGRQ